MKCVLCKDTGWVCENHLDRPSAVVSSDPDACDCGAGCNCSCNPNGEGGFDAVYESTAPEKVKTWVQ